MHYAGGILTNRMDGAVNGETGRVDVELVRVDLVPFLVDAYQAGGRDFLEHHAVRIDQEMVLVTGNPQGNMREDQIVPAVEGNQAVGGGKINAQLPFFSTHLFF